MNRKIDLRFFTSSLFEPEINQIKTSYFKHADVYLDLKREDLIHPIVSGNKFRKLKYNLIEAQELEKKILVTFGGAFSNHIAAVAEAGKLTGFQTVGIIRGEELGIDLAETLQFNSTLNFAHQCGMHLEFVSRSDYKHKESDEFKSWLRGKFGDFYLIPEGGTNNLAVKGCGEILNSSTAEYDYIACAVGTGGTISGIVEASLPHQKILGFPALKGDFLKDVIKRYTSKSNWELITNYHFGGYAKTDENLIGFINDFKSRHNILLDPIYTGKMMYGITDMIANGYFSKNTRILAIHSGGLQGITGMNVKLKQKGRSTIRVSND